MKQLMEKIGFAIDLSVLVFCLVGSYHMSVAAGNVAGEHMAKAIVRIMNQSKSHPESDVNETDSDKETT